MGIPRFYVNDEGISYQHYAGSSTTTDFEVNSDGSGSLANGNIAWNSSGEINELNVGDSIKGKVIITGDDFSGLRIPQSTDTDFYLIDIYGSQNSSPKEGDIYVRCSNGS
jgi:hypothetical protein